MFPVISLFDEIRYLLIQIISLFCWLGNWPKYMLKQQWVGGREKPSKADFSLLFPMEQANLVPARCAAAQRFPVCGTRNCAVSVNACILRA
jgi:hypothetical protein